jgi:hypothetical protein
VENKKSSISENIFGQQPDLKGQIDMGSRRVCGLARSSIVGHADASSWVLYEVAFKIEVIEKSGEVTSPHPAGFGRARTRATKRSALAAATRHLLGASRSAI